VRGARANLGADFRHGSNFASNPPESNFISNPTESGELGTKASAKKDTPARSAQVAIVSTITGAPAA
jgi:hypothetical protein